MREFVGKTAVVTGGASGIGMGMCNVFSRSGMNLVVADIALDEAEIVAGTIRANGGRAVAVEVDVASKESVEMLATSTQEAFGSVQVLCNNAGVSLPRRGIHANHDDWVWMLGVNLWGVIHGIEVFLPGMLASGEDAHIVNTSSLNGVIPSGYSAMYSAAKYGVVGLTEVLRNELAGTNVSISVLCPGGVMTRLGEWERHRPTTLPGPVDPPPHVPSFNPNLTRIREPEVVGEMTLQAILDDALYVFTEPQTRGMLEERFAKLMEGLDALDHFDDLNQSSSISTS